jgi:hypothetical protein
MSYTESEEYQKEIASQYQKRTASFELSEIVTIMEKIGLRIQKEDLRLAVNGNMNATFLTGEHVIKINKEKEPQYLANVMVSEQLNTLPVVHVLEYDCRNKTDYEVLVMQRSKGDLWQNTILEQDQVTVESIFRQILDVVKNASTLQSKRFGEISTAGEESYTDLLARELTESVKIIKAKKLASIGNIDHLEHYVRRHLPMLGHETPVLIHGDLHMGNVLHLGDQLTAVIDWDGASYLPKFLSLVSLLGLIDKPSQFVEGTPDYSRFKGIRFPYLLPILKSELPDVFADKNLVHKLNIVGVAIGLSWIAQDWSKEWNREMLKTLVEIETPSEVADLKNSYYGKLLS